MPDFLPAAPKPAPILGFEPVAFIETLLEIIPHHRASLRRRSSRNADGFVAFDFTTSSREYCSVQHYLTKLMKSISAADANQRFSALLRDVSRGEEVIVVSRGTPVARIVGVQSADRSREAAKAALIKRLGAQPATRARKRTRAELYE